MGIVLHCLHLSTARSVEDCEKCLNLLLLLSDRLLLLLNLLTMTMLIHQLILTSTHSSTLMTPLIETFSLTGMELILEVTLLLPMVSPPALTALESTPSSTLLMHTGFNRENSACC